MPKVSVIIPTFNRPELLLRAARSVLAQTFQDFEVIVVDDGDKVRAEDIVHELNDDRIRYIKNEPPKRGGGATRNVGIKASTGEYIAFLDDDDAWLPEKLKKQVSALEVASPDVGFCFSAVVNDLGNEKRTTTVLAGVHDYRDIALRRFNGFLTVTLIFRRAALLGVGVFDENIPSHQEPELMIRVTRTWKGLGINEPLALVNMTPHEHIGGDPKRRIRGREMILEKHAALFVGHNETLAYHHFQIGLWCRDSGDRAHARKSFFAAFLLTKNLRYLVHALCMLI